jgi:hypothetical protein
VHRITSAAALLLVLVLPFVSIPAVAAQGTVSCAAFDAWEWVQAVFESDPKKHDSLDPDGDGTACPELPQGFATAFWTTAIPADVQEAQLIRIIDGDTLEVTIEGVSNRVRIYRADTPETQNEQHCGGIPAACMGTKVYDRTAAAAVRMV